MAIPSTPLPDYTIQQPGLLANLGKMVQLKNMLGEEKELPLNLQLKQQQVAQSQQQTQQQQALAPSQQQEASARASSATSQAAMNDRPEVAAGATGLLDEPRPIRQRSIRIRFERPQSGANAGNRSQ
jgi:hypothetical protein